MFVFKKILILAIASAMIFCVAPTVSVALVTATCSASPTTALLNQTVNWSATASGATGGWYYWEWYGSVYGSLSSEAFYYTTPGKYTAYFLVADNSGIRALSAPCSTTVVATGSLTATCTASSLTIQAGHTIVWTATPSGGTLPYTYQWNGNVSGTTVSVSNSYAATGAKSATVTITDSASHSVTSSSCSTTVSPALPVCNNENIWVSNWNQNSVTEFSAASGAIIGTTAVGTWPTKIKTDNSQNVWVINQTSANITKFNGKTGAKIGTYSTGSGSSPNDFAFDAFGNVWVANWVTNNVVKLNGSTGVIMATYPLPAGAGPTGILIDGSGNAWVDWCPTSGSDPSKIYKLNGSTGLIMATYNPGGITGNILCASTTLAMDTSGNVWVLNAPNGNLGGVTELNSSGTLINAYSAGDGPSYIVADADGNVWVTNGNEDSVVKLNSAAGGIRGVFLEDWLDFPWGTAVDSSGNIWIANIYNNNVKKFSSSGSLIRTYSGLPAPWYIAISCPITATCSVLPTSAYTGSPVTWTATANGGTGTYTYSWAGACTGSSQSCVNTFTIPGTQNATVTVTDSAGNSATSTVCSTTITNPPLSISCSVAPTQANIGNTINWSSITTGGTGPYTYSWAWTGTGINDPSPGTTASTTRTYSTIGTKTGTVTVTDSLSATANSSACTTTIRRPVTAFCTVKPRLAKTNQTIEFTAHPGGGEAGGDPTGYTYNWSGTNGVNGLQIVTTWFITSNTYHASVTVTDTATGNTFTTPAGECNVVVNSGGVCL